MAELAKANLFSKDPECDVNMTVHFNPKEISIEKQVTWQPKEGAITDEPPEEFGKPTPASLSVTLHFDTYEQKASVKQKYTDPLSKLSRIMNQSKKRPPLCMFSWGEIQFQGVVESLTVKFTMFLSNGTPVRAECTLKMKEASQAVTGKSGG
jgi:hypothetical protein